MCRVGFFARCRGTAALKGRVALLTFPERAPAGLDQAFEVPRETRFNVPFWKRYQFDFTCDTDTLLGSSLQFYLDKPGLLAIDDVSVREIVSEDALGPELVKNGDMEEIFRDQVKTYLIPPGSCNALPPDLNQVREFYTRIAGHFRGRVKYWDVLGEPSWLRAEPYASFIKEAYQGIKEGDPDAVVVGGLDCISMMITDRITCLWDVGAHEFFDVVSTHCYDGKLPPEMFEKPLEAVNSYTESHGGLRPIRMCEGWRSADDDPIAPLHWVNPGKGPLKSEREYGDWIVRYGTILHGNNVDCIIWYGLPNPPHLTYGSYYPHWGLKNGCVPMKIFPVQGAFCHIVTPDARIEKKLYFFEREIFAYVFSRRDDAVAIAWCRNITYQIDRALFKGVELLDIFAEPLSGKVVMLGRSPIYLIGDSVEEVLDAVANLRRARQVKGVITPQP